MSTRQPPPRERQDAAADDPLISVVIPYFEDPESLTAVLAGLADQDCPGGCEVIVADDGSAAAPEVPAGVRLVRQEDRGFRAAAARNLGAGEARGRILVFLDGDTVPAPGCLQALAECLQARPWTVAVGSRRMLDLSTDPPTDLGEPEWLTQAWRAHDDLRGVDDAGFRFIISAVLACTRELFEAVGGFDASMVGYGGEDWEFAWQTRLAGAEYRHVPEALTHHRGGDWAHRWGADTAGKRAEKNGESMALAARITHPIMRPAGVVFTVPDICVHLDGADLDRADVGCAVTAVTALLASGDVHVVLGGRGPGDPGLSDRGFGDPGESAATVVAAFFAADPRVHSGAPQWGRYRPRFEVRAEALIHPGVGELQRACEEAAAAERSARVLDSSGRQLAEISPARAVARNARAAVDTSVMPTKPMTMTRNWRAPDAPVSLEDLWRDAAEQTTAKPS